MLWLWIARATASLTNLKKKRFKVDCIVITEKDFLEIDFKASPTKKKKKKKMKDYVSLVQEFSLQFIRLLAFFRKYKANECYGKQEAANISVIELLPTCLVYLRDLCENKVFPTQA